MADANVTSSDMSDEHNHFPIAAAIAQLGKIAKHNDKDGMIRAAGYLDMAPALLLRGVSFLSECLEAYDEPPPMQAKLARTAIQEITALCAALMDIDCDAENYRETKRMGTMSMTN
ncbi:MAG: hypothetical protein ACM3X0_05795 [Bacteroidota bacterium]